MGAGVAYPRRVIVIHKLDLDRTVINVTGDDGSGNPALLLIDKPGLCSFGVDLECLAQMWREHLDVVSFKC